MQTFEEPHAFHPAGHHPDGMNFATSQAQRTGTSAERKRPVEPQRPVALVWRASRQPLKCTTSSDPQLSGRVAARGALRLAAYDVGECGDCPLDECVARQSQHAAPSVVSAGGVVVSLAELSRRDAEAALRARADRYGVDGAVGGTPASRRVLGQRCRRWTRAPRRGRQRRRGIRKRSAARRHSVLKPVPRGVERAQRGEVGGANSSADASVGGHLPRRPFGARRVLAHVSDAAGLRCLCASAMSRPEPETAR